MTYRIAACTLICLVLLCTLTGAQERELTAEGSVIAIQKATDEVRTLDPHSMGDLVEVWMIRVHRWPRSEKQGFILVEYTHHDSLISDSELDLKRWRFQLRPAPPAQSGTCLSWWSQQRSFQPTAQWKGRKLPDPKRLPCYLMEQHPIAIGLDGPKGDSDASGKNAIRNEISSKPFGDSSAT